MYYVKGIYAEDYYKDEDGNRMSWGTRDAVLEYAVKVSRANLSSLVVFQDVKAICRTHNGHIEWLIPMKGPYQ